MIGPLLYLSGLTEDVLIALVHGISGVHPDAVTFPEGGGSTDLEFAIPRVPGMDEVVVDVAQLRVLAETPELELSTYQVTDAPDGGSLLDLGAESRLRRVVVDPPAAATTALASLHLVVRAAPKRVPGPPVFADPPFPLDSKMYAPALGGLTVSTTGDGRQLSFPAAGAAGAAWLLQYATGTEATNLTPRTDRFAVRRVTVNAAATDVSLVIRGASTEDPGIPLWDHPGAFLPEAGEQEINFTPLAQKHLTAALTGSASPTLAIPLRLSSASGGAVRVVARTLVAWYLVRPLGPAPVSVRIGGDWTRLDLRAPTARRPGGSTLRLRLRHAGRELNGSRRPPLDPPRSGVRVGDQRLVAVATPVTGAVALASVRVLVAVGEAAEAVLELHADAAGAPGAPIAAPVVRQLAAPPAGSPPEPAWLEFELPNPVQVAGTIWAVLRTNRGRVHWFTEAGPAEVARVSVDSGASWGVVDDLLVDPGEPLVQLFHAVSTPDPPTVELFLAGSPAGAIALGPVAEGSREFLSTDAAVPASVLAALGAATGTGGEATSTTPLVLFCRAVGDLVVEELTLSYHPFATVGG